MRGIMRPVHDPNQRAQTEHGSCSFAPVLLPAHEALVIHPYRTGGASFAISSFGATVGVHLCDAALLDSVLDRLPPGWVPSDLCLTDCDFAVEEVEEDGTSCHDDSHMLFEGEVLVRRPTTVTNVLDVLASRIEDRVAELAHPELFIHAGVVIWRGKAILLPAASYEGKSTLVAALVEAGAEYFSDEYAVLDHAGRVHPFPRKLSLRSGPLGADNRGGATQLAFSAAYRDGAPVGLVAFLTFESGAEWQTEVLSSGNALMELCAHTVAIRRRPEEALAILSKVVTQAEAVKGVRGEARQASSAMLGLADRLILR